MYNTNNIRIGTGSVKCSGGQTTSEGSGIICKNRETNDLQYRGRSIRANPDKTCIGDAHTLSPYQRTCGCGLKQEC